MKIKKLTMENFGLFKEKRSFEFSTDGQKNSTMIIGKNGGGKTTIVYAIRYALFGESGLKTHPHQHRLSEWPNFYSARDGDGEISVELKIELNDGSVRRIQRKRKFFQTPIGEEVTLEPKDQVTIFDEHEPIELGKDSREINKWIEKKTLPFEVSQFLFADLGVYDVFFNPDYNHLLVRELKENLVNEDVVNEMNIIWEKLDHWKFHDFKFRLIDGELEFGDRNYPWAGGEQMILSLIFILGVRNIHAPDSFFVFEGLGRLGQGQSEEVLRVILDNVSQSIFLTPIDDPDVSKFFTQSLFLD